MQQAFVTGGSGFLGRYLISGLRQRGVAVRALARTDAAVATVTKLGAVAVRGDLDDVAAMTDGMRGCDVVFHAAAYAKQHGPRAEFFRGNVTGTENTLRAAQGAGVGRFVHIGTEAVLADGRPIVRADETRPRATKPAGLYPLTKGLAEAAVVAANKDGFVTCVVRPRWIWGKDDTSVLPEFVDAVKQGRFAWFGGADYPSSTCHVVNVVEGALLAAERGRPGEIYFLTDGEPIMFRGFVTRMLATQGVHVGARTVPRWVAAALARLTGWMKHPPITRTALALMSHEVTVSDGKARRELGYRGVVTVEQGLAEMKAG